VRPRISVLLSHSPRRCIVFTACYGLLRPATSKGLITWGTTLGPLLAARQRLFQIADWVRPEPGLLVAIHAALVVVALSGQACSLPC